MYHPSPLSLTLCCGCPLKKIICLLPIPTGYNDAKNPMVHSVVFVLLFCHETLKVPLKF